MYVLGEANRSRPTRPIRSLDDSALWFTDALDGTWVDRFAVVGNSFGGFTATEYARRMADRVQKLVLVGPAATLHSIRAA